MTSSTDLAPLRSWLDCDLSPATAAGLISRPAFTEAARALNRVKVAAATHPVMALLSRDAGHYVAAALAVSLHGKGAITLPRLEAAFAETKFMSPGRARSLLGYLRHTGLVTQVSRRQGREAATYAPSPDFIAAWCERMRRGLETAALIEPAAQHLLDHMDDPSVAIAFAQVRGEAILAGLARAVGHDLPFVRIFNHRLGGGRALALLLSRDAGDGLFATASVPWALDDIVQHCGISRVQARRLFNDALAEGLVSIADGWLTWTAAARQFIYYSTGFEFIGMLASAATTVNMFPQVFATAEVV